MLALDPSTSGGESMASGKEAVMLEKDFVPKGTND